MDRMKRIQAAMLAFVMVAVCVSVIGAGDSDADSAISPDTSWYNETDVSFKISTAEQLAGLAQLVNLNCAASRACACAHAPMREAGLS